MKLQGEKINSVRNPLFILGGLLVGILTLVSQLFHSSSHIIFVFLALIPIGLVYIIEQEDAVLGIRRSYLAAFSFQAISMAALYLETALFIEIGYSILRFIGYPETGMISGMSLNAATRPILYTMVLFGIVELAMDEKLRDYVDDPRSD